MPDTFSPFAGALLLCVDMQEIFLDEIDDSDAITSRVSFSIECARILGLHVAFTEQVPQKLGPTIPSLKKLAPKAHTFGKSTFSALADDGIRDALKSLNVEHLILCGIETSICIYQTALDAIDNNFQVTILTDATGGRRPEDARPSLESLIRAGAYVLPSEAVFYSILGSASHPAFKTFNAAVKKYD
ncbi:isochorismatase [Nibricoccus aquaticus]|uniref:Isochorismatase n=1 Tax=Nibricoccus aquaticus TaxID=2576891 RepID=A0A290Q1Y0_9BACT|nr:isochorismatase family protein [Nibricoccus aquaticus]ATC62655.1 isochorismatase [Nibricoccus aquaticus]